MSWLLDLFGDLLSWTGVPVPQRKNVDYEGAVTVVDDPVKKRTVITVGAANGASASMYATPDTLAERDNSGGLTMNLCSATGVGLGTWAEFGGPDPVATVGAATTQIISIQLAPGTTTFHYDVTATISSGDTSKITSASFSRVAVVSYPAGGSATIQQTTAADPSVTAPFASSTSSTPGGIYDGISGSSYLITARGIGAVNAWAAGTIAAGAFVYNTDTPSHLYLVPVGGAVSTMPTGTSNQIKDGVAYVYLGAYSTLAVTWTLNRYTVATG